MISLTHIAPPAADYRRVDSATRAYDLPALIRQADSAPIVTRSRGRMGQGERTLAPAPRLGDGKRHAVTIRHYHEDAFGTEIPA